MLDNVCESVCRLDADMTGVRQETIVHEKECKDEGCCYEACNGFVAERRRGSAAGHMLRREVGADNDGLAEREQSSGSQRSHSPAAAKSPSTASAG